MVSGWAGLGSARLGWAGLGGAGLGCPELGWVGMGWAQGGEPNPFTGVGSAEQQGG